MNNLIERLKADHRESENILLYIIVARLMLFSTLFLGYNLTLALGYSYYYTWFVTKLCFIPNIHRLAQQPWSILTYSFVQVSSGWHGLPLDVFELFLSSLALYGLGKIFIRFFNSRRFIEMYIITTISAALCMLVGGYFLPTATQPLFRGLSIPIYGLFASLATVMPNYTFLLFGQPVRVKYMILFFICFSALSLLNPITQLEGVAKLGALFSSYAYVRYVQYR